MKIFIIIFVVSLLLIPILKLITNYFKPSDPIEYIIWKKGNGLDSYTIMMILTLLDGLITLISGGIILIKLLIRYLC